MTPLALSDEQGKIVWQASVKDYLLAEGVDASSGTPSPSAPLGIDFNLRGSNQYFDAETGLHYNTNRYFDPVAARYLTPDPLGLAVGPDLYAFALGQPHTLSDPLGLQASVLDSSFTSDADVAAASYGKKLEEIFKVAARQLPSEVGNALLELVSPQAIGTTVAIFALWAGSHFFGVGEIFDVLAMSAAYVAMGKGAVDAIEGFVKLGLNTNGAKSCADIKSLGDQLARTLGGATATVASGVLIKKIFNVTEGGLGNGALDKLKRESGNPSQSGTANLVNAARNTIASLRGKLLTGKPIVNNTVNNTQKGNLGEQIAATILKEETGLAFRSLQNRSNNGADLINIDPVTKKITHVEVKCTSCVTNENYPSGDPVARFNAWITEAATGTINGKQVSAADQAFARDILQKLQSGQYTLDNKLMQVNVPVSGQGGIPSAELRDWLGPNQFSPCVTSVCK